MSNKQRIVVKAGTGILTDAEGKIANAKIGQLCSDIAVCMSKGTEVILVSSGAISAGCDIFAQGKKRKELSLMEKQAAAAVGQARLMHVYITEFEKHGITAAQVLLTRQDMEDRGRYLNARNTLTTLLNTGVIPIINENDTIAVDEIKFGDNDTLAAIVATKIDAEHLIILTNVDGLYTDYGQKQKGQLIPEVCTIDETIEKLSCNHGSSQYGIGGMRTKINAAKIVTTAGITLSIANGTITGNLQKIIAGERIGTRFIPAATGGMSARERWIAFGMHSQGKIVLDPGAVRAVRESNKSLLPAGITGVEGEFEIGDMVSITSEDGVELARGLVNYTSTELQKIKRLKSAEIIKVLGYKHYDEAVHRDNLVII
ncbi:MAG: glutamate 5-kinase [Elusimicrobiota bacterium]